MVQNHPPVLYCVTIIVTLRWSWLAAGASLVRWLLRTAAAAACSLRKLVLAVSSSRSSAGPTSANARSSHSCKLPLPPARI